MASAADALKQLKAKGTEKVRALYGRHGHAAEKTLGVLTADMKVVAKPLKGQQTVAMELYATGMMEAMYTAGMVADGAKMSRAELEKWAKAAVGLPMIECSTIPWVTVENPAARELALKWIAAKDPGMQAMGWTTYSGIVSVMPDEALDLKEIEALMAKIVKEIHTADNRVRRPMNTFVICVGSYVKALNEKAKAAGKKMGVVTADFGTRTARCRRRWSTS